MKKIITILVLSFVLASCGSESGKQNNQPAAASSRDVAFRAHYTWVSTVTYDRLVDDKVQIVYADSAFRAGDTVTIDDKNYILEEKVK